ncbi:hypothetical protein DV735_g3298, partial [Chaetothyriales sp. CBS 134920]
MAQAGEFPRDANSRIPDPTEGAPTTKLIPPTSPLKKVSIVLPPVSTSDVPLAREEHNDPNGRGSLVHVPVRTIPPWVRDASESDLDSIDELPAVLVAQHNNAPSTERPLLGGRAQHGLKRRSHHERTSRWLSFTQASAYPSETDGWEVVGPDWVTANQADYSKEWLEGRYTGDDGYDGDDAYHAYKTHERVWYQRAQYTILRNPFIPLGFRITIIIFALAALALGATIYRDSGRILKCQRQPVGSRTPYCVRQIGERELNYYRDPSGLMAVIVDTIAVVYSFYITYDEYFSKPLGLRPARQKARLILLDTFFIVFQSANLALSFSALTLDEGSCAVGSDPTTSYRFHSLCRRQEALSSVLLVSLVAWLFTFSAWRQLLSPHALGQDQSHHLYLPIVGSSTMAPATAAPTTSSTPVPRPRADLNATWTYLEENVDNVMNKLQDGLDMKTYMGVYTAVHDFCTSHQASTPPTAAAGHNPAQPLAPHRGAHLLGEELYTLLGQYLSTHLHTVLVSSESHVDEALLTFYIREWKRYTDAAIYNNHLFRYLNRHWVKREMDEGKKNVYDVYTLHLVKWRDDFFSAVSEKVMDAVLKLVEKQRNGETIDQLKIKAIVDSFVSLGLDENDSTKSTLDVYRLHFERPFLAATKTYYENESRRFVAENSVVEYMKKAEARLEEEKERVGLYLHIEISKKLQDTCNEALITAHSVLLRDEFQLLLDNERTEDLARMYKLLSRIKDGLDPLRNRFETHVRKAGLAAVEKVAAQGDNFEPKVYVDALLEIHGKYQELVNSAFTGESEFVRSLDNACKEFVNRNQICKASSTKSPELLAKYADSLLKKGAKAADESELEELLVQIMVVFKYIEDKDVFQKFYSRMLAKRLVHSSSVSDDAETSMISKLKEACGYEYTNKLQRMFQDVQISKDLNASYKDFQDKILEDGNEKRTLDSTYQILGTGFWPLSSPTTPFAPPPEISRAVDSFTRFYDQKHNGRKLQWLWQLCKGEVRASYIKNQKIPYTFQVSTYQMAILLLFNEADKYDYADIRDITKLNDDHLEPALGILVKARVLTPNPDDGKPTIEEDRKLLLQAVIVRIMKGRKKLKHVHLVEEVINQVRSRFPPKISDIKKNIDALMEKDYIERLDNDELAYIA